MDDARLEVEAYAAARRIAEGAPLPAPLTAAEIEENFAYFATEDYRIGMRAFAEKRKPEFKGR